MHRLYDLCCRLWSVPAPVAPRRGRSYRPRLDVLEWREPPTSGVLSLSVTGLPAAAVVGQDVSLTIEVQDTQEQGPITATVNWGDGPVTYTLNFINVVGQNDYLWGTDGTQPVPVNHGYGAPGTYTVAVSIQDPLGTYGPVTEGTASIAALPAVVIPAAVVSPAGNTTTDFFVLAQKSSYNSSSGTTKLPEMLLNVSGQTINGPFYVVLSGLRHSVKLGNEIGISKVTAPGDPYLFVPLGQLAPGQMIPFTLSFHNSTGGKVSPGSFQTMIYAGVPVF